MARTKDAVLAPEQKELMEKEGAESFIKEKLSYVCLTKSVTHCFNAASLSIAGAKVGGFNLTAKHII